MTTRVEVKNESGPKDLYVSVGSWTKVVPPEFIVLEVIVLKPGDVYTRYMYPGVYLQVEESDES